MNALKRNRTALAVLLALTLFASAWTGSTGAAIEQGDIDMAINPHRGTPAEQVAGNQRKLLDRVERLEHRDRLTRVHPVTGSTDFVGTVFKTPDGIPVFVASEEGLEAPPTPGSSRVSQDVVNSPTGGMEILLFGKQNSSFLDVADSEFAGVFSNMVTIPMRTQIEGSHFHFEVDYRLEATYTAPDGTTETNTSPVFTATAANSDLFGSPDQRWSTGTWRWRHGFDIAQLGTLKVVLQAQVRTINGQSHVEIENAEIDPPNLVTVRGSDMDPDYSASQPFRLDSDLS